MLTEIVSPSLLFSGVGSQVHCSEAVACKAGVSAGLRANRPVGGVNQ